MHSILALTMASTCISAMHDIESSSMSAGLVQDGGGLLLIETWIADFPASCNCCLCQQAPCSGADQECSGMLER